MKVIWYIAETHFISNHAKSFLSLFKPIKFNVTMIYHTTTVELEREKNSKNMEKIVIL